MHGRSESGESGASDPQRGLGSDWKSGYLSEANGEHEFHGRRGRSEQEDAKGSCGEAASWLLKYSAKPRVLLVHSMAFRSCGLTFELSRPWRRTPAGHARTIPTLAWSGQTVAAVAGRRLERGVRPHCRCRAGCAQFATSA